MPHAIERSLATPMISPRLPFIRPAVDISCSREVERSFQPVC
jgi:hypothetical protein